MTNFRMLDFDKGKKAPYTYTGAELKSAVILDGRKYMLKFPDPPRHRKATFSYKNNQFSEYIGCRIFQSCGINAQNTELGYRTNIKGVRKLVVGCEDFTQDGHTLYEFRTFASGEVESEGRLEDSIENVNYIIDNNELLVNKEEIKERFWDMFVVDGLIGNADRHFGNWGFQIINGEYVFSPVYDCGSSLGSWLDDEAMEENLKSSAFKNEEYNAKSVYMLDGKKIFYREIFQNPPKELQEAMKRIVPNIDMDEIHEIVNSVEVMSDVRKEYMKKALDMRFDEIIEPSYKRIMKREKQLKQERLRQQQRGLER